MKFRKKPVVIEAVQFDGSPLPIEDAPKWFTEAFLKHWMEPGYIEREGNRLRVRTLEGLMTADLGDWIIRGVKDELYPCKPDIFAATYEPAE
jgi:hypothetical protein